MKSIFKYFYFNKNERIALFVFLVVLVLLNICYQLLKPPSEIVSYEFSDVAINWNDTSRLKNEITVYELKPTKNHRKPTLSVVHVPQLININLADSIEFRKLKGIGKVFSSRIVRYRNWLGGFYSHEQLLEVYGIDSVLFDLIAPHLKVSIDDVIKMKLNTCRLKELSSHPYISYKVAKSIIKYREHHGAYQSINDLKHIPLIDEKLFRKIAYYLELE